MKKQIFKVLVLLALALLQEGCMQKEIPQEGEVVTWKLTPELIVKAKLGERRKHIPDTHCFRCESEFYRPEYERYIGQFPIDYQPKEFDKLDETEAKAMPVTLMDNGIEFNLMLNGSTVQATDQSPHSLKGLDNQNQVKVFITSFGLNNLRLNTRQFFESELMKELDANSKITQYGLDCYKFKDGHAGQRCFGTSKNTLVSGFDFYSSADADTPILVRSNELIYGGVKVEWFTNQKNIDQARNIDAAIWRLLASWNVSPLNNVYKQQ